MRFAILKGVWPAVSRCAGPIALFLTLTVAPKVWAQSAALPEVLVTGTRIPGDISENDSNVTVIDRAEIEARHPRDALELLRTIPGVIFEQAGGRGSVASVFTRGAKPNFTVVLIDGVKVNDPTNTRGGSYDFSTLSIDDIDRVEIVRGPTSAIYGSDAVGGVINIITRTGTSTPAAYADLSGGRFGYVRAASGASGPIGPATASLGVSHTDDGMPVAGSVFRGNAFNGTFTAAPFPGSTLEITARYNQSHAEAFPDSSGGPLYAVLRTTDHRDIDETIAGAKFEQTLNSVWSQTLQYGLYDRVSGDLNPGIAPSVQTPSGIPPSTDSVHFERQEGTWTNRLDFGSRAHIAAGADLQTEDGRDDGTLLFGPLVIPTSYALDRVIPAAFAEVEVEPLDALQLSFGGRYDAPDHADGHFSPKVAASYAITPSRTTFEASWGEGYRLPSFYALGNPIVGNPRLKAEASSNFEAGISQAFSANDRLKVDWFDTEFTNLIDFQPSPVPMLVNLPRVHAHGFEASLDVHVMPNLTIGPFGSFTVTRNEATGASLVDVPKWQAGGTASWQPIDPVTVSLTFIHVGEMTDNSIPTGNLQLPGYERVDLSTTWTIRTGLRVYAAVQNLLNSHYEESIGFPAPQLFARAGIALAL